MAESIRVRTGDLKVRQEEWLALACRAENAFLAAAENVRKLDSCFDGQPPRSVIAEFLTVKNEGERVFDMLRGHLEKLSRISLVYIEAERSNAGVFTDN